MFRDVFFVFGKGSGHRARIPTGKGCIFHPVTSGFFAKYGMERSLKGGFSGWHPKRAAERKSKSGSPSHAEGLFEDKLLTQKEETTVCLSLGNLILFADSSSYEPLTQAKLFFVFGVTESACHPRV